MSVPVTVTVNATWRLGRVEFMSPYTTAGVLYGYGELELKEPPEESGGEAKIYGTMPAATTIRTIGDVMNETVNVYGRDVRLMEVMDALSLFFQKWRDEDALTPPSPMGKVAPAAPLTEMQPLWDPPKYDDLPPPRLPT